VSKRNPGVIRSLLAIVAGLMVIGAGFGLNEQLSPYSDGILVSGTVTGVRTLQHNGRPRHTAVITFTTQDGREVSIDDSSSSRSHPKLGKTVKVSYRPAAPEKGRVIPAYNWISILCYAVGGLGILLGFVSLFARRSGAPGLTRFRVARR
jgi:hypothetical protein